MLYSSKYVILGSVMHCLNRCYIWTVKKSMSVWYSDVLHPHVVTIMWPNSNNFVTSLPFINPVMWPHEIEKHPLNAQGTFWLLFFKYYEFVHTSFFGVLFVAYYKVGMYSISDAGHSDNQIRGITKILTNTDIIVFFCCFFMFSTN